MNEPSWIGPHKVLQLWLINAVYHLLISEELGEQGWRSGESTRLPPMWPGFKSRRRRHVWVEFVVGSLPCSERFFFGYSGFPLSSKTNISKFQFDQESGGRRTTMWMCYLQIVIYLFKNIKGKGNLFEGVGLKEDLWYLHLIFISWMCFHYVISVWDKGAHLVIVAYFEK